MQSVIAMTYADPPPGYESQLTFEDDLSRDSPTKI